MRGAAYSQWLFPIGVAQPCGCAGDALTQGEFGEQRVELLGPFELHPMPGAGHCRKPRRRLNAAQDAGALLDMRIGGRVALAPDAAEWRLHLRQGLDQRTRTREAAAAHAGAAMIGLLQPERELVDLVWISDHQLVQIIAVRREFLGLIRIRRDAPQWCRRAFEPKPVRADHRKAAQSVTELGGNAAANDPPKREAGKAQFALAGQDPVEAPDDGRGSAFDSPRSRRRFR